MENSPQLYITEFGDHEDMEEGEGEEEEIHQEEGNLEPHTMKSLGSDLHKIPYQDTQKNWNSFPCQHCERHFASKQGLERHMHIHTLTDGEPHKYRTNSNMSVGSNLGQLQHEKSKSLDSEGCVMQLHILSPTSSSTSILSAGDNTVQPDKEGVSDDHHACNYCEKIFTTHTNKRRHERRIHKQHLQPEEAHLPDENNPQRTFGTTSEISAELSEGSVPAAVQGNEGGHTEQYMLDISSNISENLSFYIDGKIVSTSTVSTCDTTEVQSGSSALVRLDTLILDPSQISQVLNLDPVSGKEISGQPLAKRRTATPPLLPQIKTELESEVVVSSSSSTLVSSLIENLLPQNTESTIVQKERTVFLSPKLKQLLEKQDGLKPTLALISDGQKPCSPVSLSVLPTGSGKFKRRTGSPPSSPQENAAYNEETPTLDLSDCDAVSTALLETSHGFPEQQPANEKDDTTPAVEEPLVKPVFSENWPPMTGESVTLSTTASIKPTCPAVAASGAGSESVVDAEPQTSAEEGADDICVSTPEIPIKSPVLSEKAEKDDPSNVTQSDAQEQTFTKNFICNVCDKLFHSMKKLSHHVGDHADEWPYKCEFCVLLFGKPSALLDHRSSLHGVGKTYVCSVCTKEFVYLCNLKQHQEELHPGQQCSYSEEEKGKLRPQNYNNSTKANVETTEPDVPEEPEKVVKKEESEVDVAAEELFTTIKIMASDGGKIKGPDVRLGINQHYPSFKPPPFPYHNRSPTGSAASATNFTTHNIPQTFSTAIRCTKCGKSFDNMPELHTHILACANASDKRRYTPKKNPIPLRHFAKTQNGVLSTTNSTNGLNASNRSSQSNRSRHHQESTVKMKLKVLNRKKKKLVQRAMPQRSKSVVPSSNKISPAQVDERQEVFVCPHCSREFTMRRSRTKHMAVCPKKPKEVKKRKDGGISVTKENDGHLHRRVGEKQQAPPQHKTRLRTTGSAKRPAVLPVQTVFANKRSKIIIKESMQPKQETPTLSELPVVRTFNPAMRQYSRVQHNVKGIPIKITIVKPQQTSPQKSELLPNQSREEATRAVGNSYEQSPTA
ncbi:PR domain zinc finger protein 2 isoform X2 [Xyrichtys novacula]|uniref:PR domain zinc finger protein 2 isoform X2 n=1 Tax=Xyrichtys novacula TaxID=13765 RepID=A0AAV1HLA4_XYRNO|nr:PR domain zinc finger protein 2 isoform X2 [Xyrichtys novacula]